MHLVHIGCSPAYITELVSATSELPSRRSLRSASSQRYEVPLTKLKFGERLFSFAGPAAWNALTPELHNLSNTHTFKKQLKTYLFNKAYSWYRPTSNFNAPLVTPGVNSAVEMTLFVFVFVFEIISWKCESIRNQTNFYHVQKEDKLRGRITMQVNIWSGSN